MPHYRSGHWRTSVNGNVHWVDEHSVNGADSHNRRYAPSSVLGVWGRYEAQLIQSFTIPNARCPVCGELVFFYRSESGGSVFFDPPLGPPWPKHPCTDYSRNTKSQTKNAFERAIETNIKKPVRSNIDASLAKDLSEKALSDFRESRWHPLLEMHIIKKGAWWKVRGYDPIDSLHCEFLCRKKLNPDAPTFIRVVGPERIKCRVEQIDFDENGIIIFVAEAAWFGAASVEDARRAKRASENDVASILDHAKCISFRFLGADNRLDEVSTFVDLKASLYWYKRAATLGSLEGKLRHAFLTDLVEWVENEDTEPLNPLRIDGVIRSVKQLERMGFWAFMKADNPAIEQLRQSVNATEMRNTSIAVENIIRIMRSNYAKKS